MKAKTGLPYINGSAMVTADPQISRAVNSNKATVTIPLIFTSVKPNGTRGDQLEITGILWGDKADSAWDFGLRKGDIVTVVGRIKGDTVNTPSGKIQVPILIIDTIADCIA